MRISFMLISQEGVPQTGKTATIQLSVDGAPFVASNVTVNETGAGCYYADIPASALNCQYNVLIRVTSEGCQDTIFEYRPESTADEIADAVWSADKRTLTSLNTGNTKATQYVSTTRSTSTSPQQKQGLTVKQVLGGK